MTGVGHSIACWLCRNARLVGKLAMRGALGALPLQEKCGHWAGFACGQPFSLEIDADCVPQKTILSCLSHNQHLNLTECAKQPRKASRELHLFIAGTEALSHFERETGPGGRAFPAPVPDSHHPVPCHPNGKAAGPMRVRLEGYDYVQLPASCSFLL